MTSSERAYQEAIDTIRKNNILNDKRKDRDDLVREKQDLHAEMSKRWSLIIGIRDDLIHILCKIENLRNEPLSTVAKHKRSKRRNK